MTDIAQRKYTVHHIAEQVTGVAEPCQPLGQNGKKDQHDQQTSRRDPITGCRETSGQFFKTHSRLGKNTINTLTCSKTVKAANNNIRRESTIRSVTTVPKDFVKEVPSYFFSTPQRKTSPTRGTTRLEAYERNTACTHEDKRGRSSNGSKACRQRAARKTCANTPKGMESHIHVQFIPSFNASHSPFQSKSRYIHHKIKPPNTKGKAILNNLLTLGRFRASSVCARLIAKFNA